MNRIKGRFVIEKHNLESLLAQCLNDAALFTQHRALILTSLEKLKVKFL